MQITSSVTKQFCCFSGLLFCIMHSFVTAYTFCKRVIASEFIMNYGLVKFLDVN